MRINENGLPGVLVCISQNGSFQVINEEFDVIQLVNLISSHQLAIYNSEAKQLIVDKKWTQVPLAQCGVEIVVDQTGYFEEILQAAEESLKAMRRSKPLLSVASHHAHGRRTIRSGSFFLPVVHTLFSKVKATAVQFHEKLAQLIKQHLEERVELDMRRKKDQKHFAKTARSIQNEVEKSELKRSQLKNRF